MMLLWDGKQDQEKEQDNWLQGPDKNIQVLCWFEPFSQVIQYIRFNVLKTLQAE